MQNTDTSYQQPGLSLGHWITMLASAGVVVSFFLPWATLKSIINFASSGIGFILGGTSKASGLPLQVFLITLVVAIICLLLSLPFFRVQGQSNRFIPFVRIFLAICGMLPFLLIKSELSTWKGGKVVTNIGLWLAILAMVGVLVGTLLSARDELMAKEVATASLSDEISTFLGKAGSDDESSH